MRAAAIFVVVLVAACGDSGGASGRDLSGIYMVTHHTFAQQNGPTMPAPCATEGPAATMPPFFRIAVDPDFGPGYEDCTSSDPASCGDIALYDFQTPTDTGWKTVSSNTQMGGGTDCSLYHEEYTAEQQDDGSVRIEAREWTDFMPSECTLDAADKLANQPMCRTHEVVVGTLVQ